MTGLLKIGRQFWFVSVKSPLKIDARKTIVGVLSSRGKAYEPVYRSLDEFFTELAKEGLPFATRIIREETGMTTRDDNVDEVVLPPHESKHRCYARWCYTMGWIVQKKSTAKTIYKKCEDYKERPNDDDDEVPL